MRLTCVEIYLQGRKAILTRSVSGLEPGLFAQGTPITSAQKPHIKSFVSTWRQYRLKLIDVVHKIRVARELAGASRIVNEYWRLLPRTRTPILDVCLAPKTNSRHPFRYFQGRPGMNLAFTEHSQSVQPLQAEQAEIQNHESKLAER